MGQIFDCATDQVVVMICGLHVICTEVMFPIYYTGGPFKSIHFGDWCWRFFGAFFGTFSK